MLANFARRAVVAASVAFLALGMPSLAAAQTDPAHPGISMQILGQSETRPDDARGRSYIVEDPQPGQTIQRRVRVRNRTGTTQSMSLYAGSAEVSATNGFSIGIGRAGNRTSSWVSVDPAEVSIADEDSVEATVTITVPASAARGEQYAMLWAETAPVGGGSGVGTASRVGVRIYLNVGGDGTGTTIEIPTIIGRRDDDGRARVEVEIRNVGPTLVDPIGTIELHDGPSGMAIPEQRVAVPSIPPGQSQTMQFEFDASVPDGPWEADLSVSDGANQHEAKTEVSFDEPGSGRGWLFGSVAGLIVFGTPLLWFLLRRKRRDEEETEPLAAADE